MKTVTDFLESMKTVAGFLASPFLLLTASSTQLTSANFSSINSTSASPSSLLDSSAPYSILHNIKILKLVFLSTYYNCSSHPMSFIQDFLQLRPCEIFKLYTSHHMHTLHMTATPNMSFISHEWTLTATLQLLFCQSLQPILTFILPYILF